MIKLFSDLYTVIALYSIFRYFELNENNASYKRYQGQESNVCTTTYNIQKKRVQYV